MFHFLHPEQLLWGAVALPVILLYLFRVRARRLTVSTSMFWRQLLDERQSRPAFRQIRNLLSLLVQLLVVLLLLLVLAGWRPTSVDLHLRPVVLIIDNSRSMQTPDQGVSRLQRALLLARRQINSAHPDLQLAILATTGTRLIQCGLTTDRRLLRQALDAITISGQPSRTADSIRYAGQMVHRHAMEPGAFASGTERSSDSPQIILLSDGCFPEALSVVRNPAIAWELVGSPTDNVAITGFQVQQDTADSQEFQVFAEVTNFGTKEVQCRLFLELEGVPVDVIPQQLHANERRQHVSQLRSLSGGRLTLSLRDIHSIPASAGGDTRKEQSDEVNGLSSDDTATAVLPPTARIPVTLVTAGNLFLQRVLEAFPFVELTVTSEYLPQRSDEEILVLDRDIPHPIPFGPAIVIAPVTDCQLWQILGQRQQPGVLSQDSESPLLRNLRLEDLQISRAVQLQPAAEHEVLAVSLYNEPLLLRFPRADGDVLVLSIGVDQGDLPLRVAFPVFFANALGWLTSDRLGKVVHDTVPGRLEGDLRRPAELRTAPKVAPAPGFLWLHKGMLLASLVVTTAEWLLFHRRWLQ